MAGQPTSGPSQFPRGQRRFPPEADKALKGLLGLRDQLATKGQQARKGIKVQPDHKETRVLLVPKGIQDLQVRKAGKAQQGVKVQQAHKVPPGQLAHPDHRLSPLASRALEPTPTFSSKTGSASPPANHGHNIHRRP